MYPVWNAVFVDVYIFEWHRKMTCWFIYYSVIRAENDPDM